MTDEEVEAAIMRAEDEYEMLKDRVHDQQETIEALKFTIRVQQEQIEELIKKLKEAEAK